MTTLKQNIKENPDLYQGYFYSDPRIKRIHFDKRGKIGVEFQDGRLLYAPLAKFPSIKKLSASDRKKYVIFDEGKAVDFLKSNEMYQVQNFLGIPENYLKERHK